MIYLAPIHGYTEYVFRETYATHFKGIDIAITPFISLVDGNRIKNTVLRDVLPENNELMPVIPQLIGHKHDQFILMAKTLHDFGYQSVNWNLGCPMRLVAKKQRGSGLLPFPEIIHNTLKKVVPAIPNKLSLKVRLGYNSKEEIFRLIPILNQYPLEFVIVHPRLGIERYETPVDLLAFDKCKNELEHPVVYNGDINTVQRYQELKLMYPDLKGWMVGRGVLSNFFLPAALQGEESPDTEVRRKIITAFHLDFLENMKERWVKEKSLCNKLKEYWEYFCSMYRDSEKIFNEIKKISDATTLYSLINNILLSEDLKE